MYELSDRVVRDMDWNASADICVFPGGAASVTENQSGTEYVTPNLSMKLFGHPFST